MDVYRLLAELVLVQLAATVCLCVTNGPGSMRNEACGGCGLPTHHVLRAKCGHLLACSAGSPECACTEGTGDPAWLLARAMAGGGQQSEGLAGAPLAVGMCCAAEEPTAIAGATQGGAAHSCRPRCTCLNGRQRRQRTLCRGRRCPATPRAHLPAPCTMRHALRYGKATTITPASVLSTRGPAYCCCCCCSLGCDFRCTLP